MKRREWIFLAAGLILIGGSAGVLQYLKANQRLGPPGIKSSALPDTLRRTIEFPTNVPGYQVKLMEADTNVMSALPADTSMGQIMYLDSNDIPVQVTAVMMGTDRTSIHQPQFCLTGQGWAIDKNRSTRAVVRLDRPRAVELPVMKLISSRTVDIEGRQVPFSSIYVYWFVSGDAVTPDHWRRMWWMADHLARKGELQRWAYISYFTTCPPGQEEEAFGRVTKLMNLTVPDFQLVWPEIPPGTEKAQ